MVIRKEIQNNIGTFTAEELDKICSSRILVVGCGGSEYVIDQLVRLGVMTIGVVDADRFDETNMNRQLFANIHTIGKLKVEIANEYAHSINPNINFITYPTMLSVDNCINIISEYDVVLDCVDNVDSKLIIEDACSRLGKPLVFGGMSRWYGQVAVSFPDERLVTKIYRSSRRRKRNNNQETKEVLSSTTAFINCLVSALYVAMCAKVIIGKKCARNKLYLYDLHSMRVLALRIWGK